MKKTLILISIVALGAIAYGVLESCNGGGTKPIVPPQPAPLNLSVYLDLSNRLVRPDTPDQTKRDSAIVDTLVGHFCAVTRGPQILKSRNRMKVFFYPAPASPNLMKQVRNLNVDIGKLPPGERIKALNAMHGTFRNSLAQIYRQTVAAQRWIGCDIWDFFSSKKVDAQCVQKGSRNVLVIVTDGYLYAINNKVQTPQGTNYILPQTLKAGTPLINGRNGASLSSLEVLVLEVNPFSPAQQTPLLHTIENWLKAMGVKHYYVAETDANITNTEEIIEKFLGNEL